MTLDEVSNRFQISVEKLKYYEKNGLFDCQKQKNGALNYQDEDLERIRIIHTLLETGMDMDSLKQYLGLLSQGDKTQEEQIRILKKQRFQILDDIHDRQKSLDCLDYMIYEAKKERKLAK